MEFLNVSGLSGSKKVARKTPSVNCTSNHVADGPYCSVLGPEPLEYVVDKNYRFFTSN